MDEIFQDKEINKILYINHKINKIMIQNVDPLDKIKQLNNFFSERNQNLIVIEAQYDFIKEDQEHSLFLLKNIMADNSKINPFEQMRIVDNLKQKIEFNWVLLQTLSDWERNEIEDLKILQKILQKKIFDIKENNNIIY